MEDGVGTAYESGIPATRETVLRCRERALDHLALDAARKHLRS
jgi:hypothetical protein